MGPQLWMGWRAPSEAAMKPPHVGEGIGAALPRGGLWTSTWDANRRTSPWVEHTRAIAPEWLAARAAWLLTPAADVCVLELDGPKALLEALSRYGYLPLAAPAMRRVGILGREARVMDPARIVRDGYDGVQVTADLLAAARSFGLLAGWGAESTYWLRWRFVDVRPIRVRGMRQEGGAA